jgi:hypothetical protein
MKGWLQPSLPKGYMYKQVNGINGSMHAAHNMDMHSICVLKPVLAEQEYKLIAALPNT